MNDFEFVCLSSGRRAERVLFHPPGGARGRAGRGGVHPAAVAPRQLLLLARRQVPEPGGGGGGGGIGLFGGSHGRVAVVVVEVILGLRRQLLRHGHRRIYQDEEISDD